MNWLKGLIGRGTRPAAKAIPVASKTGSRGTSSSQVPANARPASRKPSPERPSAAAVSDAPDENTFGSIDPPVPQPSRRGLGDSGQASEPREPRRAPPEISKDSETNSLVTVAEGGRLANTRQRRDEADPKAIDELLKWSGEVITSPKGVVPLSDKQRRYVAMLGDGRLMIAKEKEMDNDVLSALQRLRNKGKGTELALLVDLDIIRTVYENAEKAAAQNTGRRNRGEGLQEMQKQVLDLIGEAAELGASDIHIRVRRHEAEVYLRVDGVMQKLRMMEADVAQDLCNAAFNMADASDPTYRMMEYQGARISDILTALPEGVQSVRLQFSPLSNGGRYLVGRLLYATSKASSGGDVDTLGYNNIHIQQIRRMRRKPYGINIISGPTGSGKSTTLQRALMALIREKRGTINVITIEDPPEYVIEGTAQFPVVNATDDDARNEKFRQAISAALRSDPDIVMIGEIRDKASASLAFAAAMTGHGVWASLHANNAYSILDRLRDVHVEDYKLTDHNLVTGLISQRLIRRLCKNCSVPFNKARAEQLLDEDLAERLVKVVGEERAQSIRTSSGSKCGAKGCRDGYVGREVVAETIVPDSKFMTLMRAQNKEGAYNYWLNEMGGLTMQEHALQKLVDGKISPQDMELQQGDVTDIDITRVEKIFSELS